MGLVESVQARKNTSLFSSASCDGAATLLSDQGADINLIPRSVLQGIVKANPKAEVRTPKTPTIFSNAHSSAPRIECDRQIKMDVLLLMRDGRK